VYHQDDEAKKEELKDYLINGNRLYRGLYSFTGLLNFIDDEASMVFTNKFNPLPELQAKFNSHKHDTKKVKYLAIYLTPFTKEETKRQDKRVYVMVKEFLLNREIVCQSVEPGNNGVRPTARRPPHGVLLLAGYFIHSQDGSRRASLISCFNKTPPTHPLFKTPQE
jgi:hypothetical protein